jgi:hypothetical protein
VNVRHRVDALHDPGQRGDVAELIERTVVLDVLPERLVSEDPGGDTHAGSAADREIVHQ